MNKSPLNIKRLFFRRMRLDSPTTSIQAVGSKNLHLAIECSGMHGSVALLQSELTLESVRLPTDRSSIQSLAVTVKSLVGAYPQCLKFLSVTTGPGSFTGLRLGIATAKMLALAWNLPVVPVNSLAVLAHQIVDRHPGESALIIPVMNAYRNQVFSSVWLAVANSPPIPLSGSQVLDAPAWMRSPTAIERISQSNVWTEEFELKHHATKIIVGGPGLAVYQPEPVCRHSDLPVQMVSNLQPEASWVGRLGWNLFQQGKVESAISIVADYVRASAAEEKLKL